MLNLSVVLLLLMATMFDLFVVVLVGEPLFLANSADDIDNSQLLRIATFDHEWMENKLSKISDALARNMVSQLLNFDPTLRPTSEQIFMHPFLTGRTVARMIGEAATFDVFLSYRVASDAHNAALLYDLLTSLGLRVWWDKKSLLPGENWYV